MKIIISRAETKYQQNTGKTRKKTRS